jgi:hypothetical protein
MRTDLQKYGPYEQGDTARLPENNAEILVNRGKAEYTVSLEEGETYTAVAAGYLIPSDEPGDQQFTVLLLEDVSMSPHFPSAGTETPKKRKEREPRRPKRKRRRLRPPPSPERCWRSQRPTPDRTMGPGSVQRAIQGGRSRKERCERRLRERRDGARATRRCG